MYLPKELQNKRKHALMSWLAGEIKAHDDNELMHCSFVTNSGNWQKILILIHYVLWEEEN